ncbi:hypothetical protein E4T50_11707 [Aureobasidium sp. EXF-12298]|nr:hypothetical protein E4T50_11707 [Aureobasidium sp. EXF-12298]
MSNVPAHLPGDLGEHDPRREAHPHGNEPGAGGHEVKLGSNESKGLNSDATAAEHSSNRNPASDNTSEHAFNGGSVENMDRQKRQQGSDIPGGRTGHDGVSDHLTRAGVEQGSHRGSGYDSGLTGNNNSGLTGSSHTGSGLTGSSHTGSTGSGLVAEGERALHSGNHGTHGQTGYGSTGSGLTGSQTGYGQTGSGLTGSQSGFTGSDPQERHQLHHGTAHHGHDFSHNHNTRTGELLDPASGRDTGIPGYAGGASGLTGSSHTGTGLTGSSHTGTGLTGSSHTGSTGSGLVAEGERALHSGTHGTHGQTGYGETGYGSTGSGLTGSQTGYGQTGSGLTGSHTGTGLTGSSHTGSTGSGLVAEGERALHSGNHGQTGYGSTGSGLTGSHTGTGLTGSTGSGQTGYGQTGSTGERLREDVREGERAVGSGTGAGYGSTTGSGLTGSHTTGQTGSTGERLREDVREGEHATGHNTTGTTGTEHKKASLLDKLNPLKDSDGDGKKGFMK